VRFIKPLLKAGISFALIAIVVHAFDVRGVGAYIAQVDAGTAAIVVVVGLLIALLHTVRWIAIIRAASGPAIGFGPALRLVLIGHFFNQALPSSIGGDAVRVWCGWRAGLGFAMSANTVIVDRAMTLFSLLLLAAGGLPWLFEIVADPAARWALSTVVVAGVCGYGAFIALTRLPQHLTRWRIVRALLAIAALTRTATLKPRYAVPVIGLSIVSFIGFSFIVFALGRAMQLGVSLGDCILLVPPVILITVLPVSIAGWGVREGAMVVAFSFIHVPAAAAFAVSVLFGLTLAVASLPGSVLWWLSGYRIRNITAYGGDDQAAAN
jgi:glycosyltransferase 2 family protein